MNKRFIFIVIGLLAGCGTGHWQECRAQTIGATPAAHPVRVALMDFATDDNSYTSAQAAASLTGVLQARLADEPGVEWVERAQLDRAQRELELSTVQLINGGDTLRRGKWVKADWMVTGQFSLDDRDRRTLFLEITDLQHADVLASKTVTFPDAGVQRFPATTNQVEFAAAAVQQLLSEARLRQQQAADKILVAPLFLADVTGPGSPKSIGALERDLDDALERAVAANSGVRLIHFPKVYRSLEESEMVLDGLVEADRNAWQQTADLYVWGTYGMTRKPIQGKPPGARVEIILHLWDGASPPLAVNEELPCSFFGDFSADLALAAMNRLAGKVIANARKRGAQSDAGSIRHEIAGSIIQSCGADPQSGLEDREKILQSVHMLETACFFDPDNATARLLYITRRWGRWMDFTDRVKNEFWSKWRRSEAWGKYVNRFGLKPVAVALPFPYQQEEGIPAAYLLSLDDVAEEMFPQWHSTAEMALEDKERQNGVHTWLMEAEFHGFPKEMPHDLAMKWKNEVQAEHWKRLREVVDGMNADWTPEEKPPTGFLSIVVRDIINELQPPPARLALLEKIWPECAKYAQKNGKEWVVGAGRLADEQERAIIDICAQAGKPDRGNELLAMLSQNQSSPAAPSAPVAPSAIKAMPQTVPQMVPTPARAQDTREFFSMFRLFPPNAMPTEVQPNMQETRFPKQFEVQTIEQMDFLDGGLLIRAMDERSTPSSDNNPDVSAEVLDKRSRLWVLKPGEENPTLYEPDLFTQGINAFLLNDGQLWVAGKTTGSLNLKTRYFRKYGLADGLDLPTSVALGFGGGHVFAAGDNFKVSILNGAQDRWSDLRLPPASLSGGAGLPLLLAGNPQRLVFVAGTILIRDLTFETWTNLANHDVVQHIAADDSGFWFGGPLGLYRHNPAEKSLRHWASPTTINGLFISMMGRSSVGNVETPSKDQERMDGEIQGLMKKLQADRKITHAAKRGTNTVADPLHLDWRIPEQVTALANDGDFLWIGAANYFGNYLLLLHKPSDSLVAYFPMQVRDHISSLAVSGTSVWIGTAYGDHKLLQLPKDSFLSVPQGRWVSLAISPEERAQLISSMDVRDQAMYAFYAGDDARVTALLGDVDPEKASLETLFLLAFSYDTTGLDKPELARKWFGQIISRDPDSPWAKVAQAALSENDQNHKAKEHESELLAKYDLNHDGTLDAAERAKMEADASYQRDEKLIENDQLDSQLKEVMKRFDRNNDGKLDAEELDYLRAQVALYSEAPPQMLTGRTIIVAPLMARQFPSVSEMLKEYDLNGDGGLETSELKKLAQDIQKRR